MRLRVSAPRPYVFRCVSTFSARSPVWPAGMAPEVLAHDGDDLIVRIRTRQLGRLVAGIHRVRVQPPDRVLLDLLEGAVGTFHETLVLEADGDATWLSWHGDLGLRLPVGARTVTRLVAGPLLVAEARRMLRRHRVTIEAAALASGRVTPPPRGAGR